MKTARITFHASHNYGSMLQAYALQQTILRLGYENEIINLRTLRQKQLYPAYPMVNPFSSLENLVKYILEWTIYWRERKLCIQKYQIFEQFLQDKLILTPEYVSIDQFTKEGIFLKTWTNQMEAEKELHISAANICSCCKNRLKSAGGYIWKYHNN